MIDIGILLAGIGLVLIGITVLIATVGAVIVALDELDHDKQRHRLRRHIRN